MSPLLVAVAALALTAPLEGPENMEAGPLLGLEDALALAKRQNHLLANASLEVEKSDERAAALRTRRLPQLHVDAYGARLLQSIDLTFPSGAFGTFPPLGPLPPTTTAVTVSSGFNAVVVASVSEPLTQQYRVGLGLEAAGLEKQIAGEDLRDERQRTASQVKSTYYRLSSLGAAVEALRDLVRAFEEVDGLTRRYLSEGLALNADALEVHARVARERQRLSETESGFATEHEHLNQLLGRDLATPFRVALPSELRPRAAGLPLEAARARALAGRPELRRASLRSAQAETALRVAWADWIPDVTLIGTYARLVNYELLPDQVTTVGLYLSWEPFDWGRRSDEAAERRLSTKQADEARREAEGQVSVEVGLRWRALRDTEKLLDATRLSLEAASARLELVRNRYREDAKLLRDVLEAEAQLSGARHDFTDASTAYLSAAAELERAMGEGDED